MELSVDVWSDIACPWCYVGKRRLEAALASVDVPIVLRWHAFELDPNAPAERDPSTSYAQRLASKYQRTLPQAEAMLAQMTETAATEGLTFRFDSIRSGNTFDAHRLIAFAWQHDKQDAMKERLFAAYLEEGQLMSDHDTLRRLAIEVGLPSAEVGNVLASDAFAQDVRDDEAQAASLGVRGVPFFVFGQRVAMRGAAPSDELSAAISQALEELQPAQVATGAICGPEGC